MSPETNTEAGAQGRLNGTEPVKPAVSRWILAGILATMAASGLIDGIAVARGLPEPAWWAVTSGILTSFLGFCWYRIDREARGGRRSVWANLAIVLAAPLAVPVYLLASRPRGARLRAFGRFLGFVLLMVLAALAGGVAALLVA